MSADIFTIDRKNAIIALQQLFSVELSQEFDSFIDQHKYKNGQQIIDDLMDKDHSNILAHLQVKINFKFSNIQFKLFYGVLTQIFQKHIYNVVNASLLADMLKEPRNIDQNIDDIDAIELLFGPNDDDKIFKITMFWLRATINNTLYDTIPQIITDYVARYKIFANPPLDNLAKIEKNGLKCIQVARSFTTPFGKPFDGWNKDKNLIYHFKLNIENGTAGFGLCGPNWKSWNKSIDMSSIFAQRVHYIHCIKGDNPMSTYMNDKKENRKTQNEFEILGFGQETEFRLWQNKRIKNRKDTNSYSSPMIRKENIGNGIVGYWRNGWYINSFVNKRDHIGSFYSLNRKTEIEIIMDFKSYLCRIISAENDKQILFDLTCFPDTVQMVFSFDKGRYANVDVSILQQFVQKTN
eukprot:471783_1